MTGHCSGLLKCTKRTSSWLKAGALPRPLDQRYSEAVFKLKVLRQPAVEVSLGDLGR